MNELLSLLQLHTEPIAKPKIINNTLDELVCKDIKGLITAFLPIRDRSKKFAKRQKKHQQWQQRWRERQEKLRRERKKEEERVRRNAPKLDRYWIELSSVAYRGECVASQQFAIVQPQDYEDSFKKMPIHEYEMYKWNDEIFVSNSLIDGMKSWNPKYKIYYD